MFCGDGINDLLALASADMGLSIGNTDAVIAAQMTTSRGSVAGPFEITMNSFLQVSQYQTHTLPCVCCQQSSFMQAMLIMLL